MTTPPVQVTSVSEPSDPAWRRSGDVAARIMENLAERDAACLRVAEYRGGTPTAATGQSSTMTDDSSAPDVRELLHRLEHQISELAAARKRRVHSTKSAAAYCGMNYGTFRNRLNAKTGPVQHKEGDSNGFFESDLDAWNEARLHPVNSE